MVWKAPMLGQENTDLTPASAVMHYALIIPLIVHKMAGMAPVKRAVRPLWVLVCLMAVPIASATQPLGPWTFHHANRPVKAVAIGDSITAYTQGSFVMFLQAACPGLEVVNLAKPFIGADAIREHFVQQVLRNPHSHLHATQEVWLIYQGGLNSIEDPAMTNHHIRATFVDAHRAGLHIMGISLLPWGSEHDRRWRETRGLRTWYSTRQVVDFVMGRLSPTAALGPYAKNHPAGWQAEELPDIAVDVYDSVLRDRDAPLRQLPDVQAAVRHTPWIQAQLHGLAQAQQEDKISAYVQQTLALPRWFMHKRFQALDHFHPNRDGHRLVAQLACDKAPGTWGCQCGVIRDMRWNHQQGSLEPVVTPSAK